MMADAGRGFPEAKEDDDDDDDNDDFIAVVDIVAGAVDTTFGVTK